MNFESPRWGLIEVDDSQVLHFQGGLAGFPECSHFIVMDHDRETPLKWLQCTDRPELAFLIIEPEQILPSYSLDIPATALESLGWPADVSQVRPQEIAVFVILNAEGGQLTANLRAPVITHVERRRALQLILDDPSIPLRHPVGPQLEARPPQPRPSAPGISPAR
jgi:flagellar assembly factor FliW